MRVSLLEFRMIKQAMAMVAWAAVAAAPAVVGAQTPSAIPASLATCDCPVGDARGSLRDLAAFAPLGLLGALAAAGGTPALFATEPVRVAPTIAAGDPALRREPETPITESGRSVVGDPTVAARLAGNDLPAPGRDVPASVRDVPAPVSPDSLRGGVRAPNTGTPLPSVFLLGTGLVAIGCVTIIRARG